MLGHLDNALWYLDRLDESGWDRQDGRTLSDVLGFVSHIGQALLYLFDAVDYAVSVQKERHAPYVAVSSIVLLHDSCNDAAEALLLAQGQAMAWALQDMSAEPVRTCVEGAYASMAGVAQIHIGWACGTA